MRLGFCCLLLLTGAAHAAAPPLAPNEEIVKTADGCGFVIRNDEPYVEYTRKHWSKIAWGGPCIGGLAMGEGFTSPRHEDSRGATRDAHKSWAWYGRPFGPGSSRWSNGAVGYGFTWDNKSVFYNNSLDATKGTWSDVPGMFSMVGDGDTMVSTRTPASVTVMPMGGGKSETFTCPNPNSPEGCDGLWAQHAGPVIARIKAFIAKNEPKAKARRKEVEPIVALWKKQVGSELVARGAAVAASLNEQAAEEAAQKSALAERCRDRDREAGKDYDGSVEKAEKLGRALKELYSGECAGQPGAAGQLKHADEMFAHAAQLRTLEEEGRRLKAEGDRMEAENQRYEAQQRAQSRRETFGAIVDAVTTYQTAKNAMEQQQAASAQAQAQQAAMLNSQPSGGSTGSKGSSGNQDRTSGSGNPSGMVQIPAVMNCAQHLPFTRDSFGYQSFQVRNTCGYPIKAYVKVITDGKWTTYDDFANEIAPGGTQKSRGVKSDNIKAQMMTACPTEEEMERRLGKKLTNVYFQNNQSSWGCWIQYEPSGFNTLN